MGGGGRRRAVRRRRTTSCSTPAASSRTCASSSGAAAKPTATSSRRSPGGRALLRLTVDLVRVAWGWPMFLVSVAGVVLALLTPAYRRVTLWLALPVVSYYAGLRRTSCSTTTTASCCRCAWCCRCSPGWRSIAGWRRTRAGGRGARPPRASCSRARCSTPPRSISPCCATRGIRWSSGSPLSVGPERRRRLRVSAAVLPAARAFQQHRDHVGPAAEAGPAVVLRAERRLRVAPSRRTPKSGG